MVAEGVVGSDEPTRAAMITAHPSVRRTVAPRCDFGCSRKFVRWMGCQRARTGGGYEPPLVRRAAPHHRRIAPTPGEKTRGFPAPRYASPSGGTSMGAIADAIASYCFNRAGLTNCRVDKALCAASTKKQNDRVDALRLSTLPIRHHLRSVEALRTTPDRCNGRLGRPVEQGVRAEPALLEIWRCCRRTRVTIPWP